MPINKCVPDSTLKERATTTLLSFTFSVNFNI